MSETLTQAQVARVVRGAIKAHRDSGLRRYEDGLSGTRYKERL